MYNQFQRNHETQNDKITNLKIAQKDNQKKNLPHTSKNPGKPQNSENTQYIF
tara:strand:+ start:570 stop:725 length:156 start_codon:yes stop_codon:yes gene_type:complete